MQSSDTRTHVTRSVVNHGFVDAADWARGIEELAALSDAEIDECCCETWDYWPSLPFGVTAEHAARDRALLAKMR